MFDTGARRRRQGSFPWYVWLGFAVAAVLGLAGGVLGLLSGDTSVLLSLVWICLGLLWATWALVAFQRRRRH
jgi:hypothetical protein